MAWLVLSKPTVGVAMPFMPIALGEPMSIRVLSVSLKVAVMGMLLMVAFIPFMVMAGEVVVTFTTILLIMWSNLRFTVECACALGYPAKALWSKVYSRSR